MYKWWVCIILKFFEYIKKQYKLYIDPNTQQEQHQHRQLLSFIQV
jgi:hypothetical protein